MTRQRSGFTLIELSAVILVMGLLAAGCVLSLGRMAAKHRLEGVRQELEHADGLVRSAARQAGKKQRLAFDLDNNRVIWQSGDGQLIANLVHLAGSDTLSVRTQDQEITSGQFAIDVSADGYTPDYCLTIGRDANVQHMIVAGLSGRILWTGDDKKVDNLFQALSRSGLKASGSAQVDAPQSTIGDDAH